MFFDKQNINNAFKICVTYKINKRKLFFSIKRKFLYRNFEKGEIILVIELGLFKQ